MLIRIQLYKEDTYMLRTDLSEIKTETLPGPKAKGTMGKYTEGGR